MSVGWDMMLAWLLTTFGSSAAWAGGPVIAGVVTNQNGDPMPRATVSLQPGNVEVATDREGRFEFSYLRDDQGERIKLEKRQTYRLEVFKTGFHLVELDVPYKRGAHEVDPVSMLPETLRVQDMPVPLTGSGSVSQNGGDTKEWD
ncbi:MAG: carboxypeptidase-like regulatory domain-containing protein [Myxococcota bacterium]